MSLSVAYAARSNSSKYNGERYAHASFAVRSGQLQLHVFMMSILKYFQKAHSPATVEEDEVTSNLEEPGLTSPGKNQ